MQVDRPKNQGGNKTLIIVLSAVGGVLLILIVSCGILGYYWMKLAGTAMTSAMDVVNSMQTITLVAQQFHSDLAAEQVQKAYDATSVNFRQRTPVKDFENYIRQTKSLKSSTVTSVNITTMEGQRVTVIITYNGPDGPGRLTLQLVKENSDWVIDDLSTQ